LPGIISTVVIIFILSLSSILNAGFDQIIVLLNPMVVDVGEIIDTFVYKVGLINLDYSFATAVGVFKGIVAFLLLTSVNSLSKIIRKESIY
jgi:putative aldouronate transport system permease protein